MKRFLGTAKLTHNCFWFNGIAECVTIYCTCTISGYKFIILAFLTQLYYFGRQQFTAKMIQQ